MAAASPTLAGLPRIEVVRSAASTASDPGGNVIVRIWDTASEQPLLGVTASLVGRLADGTGLSVPLEPGREPGTYGAAMPLVGTLRDLRVRIETSDTRFEVPVEH